MTDKVDDAQVLAWVTELHDKIAAIDPNLVLNITIGHRRDAPAAAGNAELAQRAITADDIRINWTDGNHFVNAFSKAGDGFANVSYRQA